jgi:hypothetical protein
VAQLVPPPATLQFQADDLLKPFIQKWEQEYPASG